MAIPKQLLEAKICNKNTCELQARIDKAIKLLENYNVFCDDSVLKVAINVLKGIEDDE